MDSVYSQNNLAKAARGLRALAHPIRLQILQLLGTGECSVQELERELQASQSSVSQHLNLLKNQDLLESRRVAQQVFYRVKDQRLLKLASLARELLGQEVRGGKGRGRQPSAPLPEPPSKQGDLFNE